MIGVDTNVLLRYVAQDEPAQAAVVRRFVERQLSPDRPGFVSLITLAEVLWVLARHFDATRAEQIVFVSELLDDPRFVVQDSSAVWLALEAAEATTIDLPDALIAFVGEHHGCTHTVTFDRRATHLRGMTPLV